MKQLIKLFLLILILNLSANSANISAGDLVCSQNQLSEFSAQRYSYIGNSRETPLILADDQTVRIDRYNKMIKIWTINIASDIERQWRVNNLGQYDNYSYYGYEKVQILIDYNNMRKRRITQTEYNCDGMPIHTSQSEGEWSSITPGSFGEGIIQRIMQRYNLE